MTHLLRELRFSARRLARKPGLTVSSILILGVVLGGATAIYTVVHGVLLQPLPYPEPEQLVQVWQVGDRGQELQFSDPNFEDLRDRSRAFEGFAQYTSWTPTVMVGEAPRRFRTAVVSAEIFDVFPVETVRGRAFLPEEHREGASAVALVSETLWRDELGGRALEGLSLQVEDQPVTVVGVLPASFDFPPGTELWIPREPLGRNPARTAHNWFGVARLAGGLSLEAAREHVGQIAEDLRRQHGEDTWMAGVSLVPLREEMVGSVRRPLLVLLAAVGALALLACANLTGLLLVHATGRRREMAVRSALGAGPGRLALPVVTEAVLLAIAGGALGIALGAMTLKVLRTVEPGNLPRLEEVALSPALMLVILGATLAVMILLALTAATFGNHPRAAEGLRTGGHGTSPGTARMRSLLVVAQLAVSLVLLVGAGLLGRSLFLLLGQDPGFRTEGVLTVELHTPPTETDEDLVRRAAAYRRILERLEALPGVRDLGGIDDLPLSSGFSDGRFLHGVPAEAMDTLEEAQALRRDPAHVGTAEFRIASPGYFDALGIPLLRGRTFREADTLDAPPAAVVSQSLAQATWGDENPLGQAVQFGNMDGDLRVFTVVGVVGDIRERSLDAVPRPTFYASVFQRPRRASSFTLVLHGENTLPSAATVRRTVAEVAPEQSPRIRPMDEVLATSVADRRFQLLVLGAFATCALLIAVLGIYGLLAYTVARRTRELGLRMALGARRAEVWRMVVAQAVVLVATGVGLGLAGALTLSRLMESLLFGVTPTDLPTLLGGAVLLAVTALLACQAPALRAMRVDPRVALNAE